VDLIITNPSPVKCKEYLIILRAISPKRYQTRETADLFMLIMHLLKPKWSGCGGVAGWVLVCEGEDYVEAGVAGVA
jgi:hypothetical protein